MLPARGTSARDDSLRAHRDFAGIQERIDASYDASVAYLEKWSRQARPPTGES